MRFQEGRTFYDAGRYGEAITAFLEAQRLAPSPALLFNIAQAYRLNGDCKHAHAYYRDFLAARPGDPNRALIESRIAEMERCVQKARTPPPVVVSTPPPPPSSTRATERPGRTKRIVGIAAAGVGVGLLAAAAVTSVQAASARERIDQLYHEGGTWTPQYDALEARAKGRERASLGLLVAGGASLLGGAFVYYLGWRDTQTIEVVPVAGGAVGTWVCRF